MLHMRYAVAVFGRLAAAALVLCLLTPPAVAGQETASAPLMAFATGTPPVAAMSDGGETASGTRNIGDDDSVAEQIFGGSYLGALFFGYPATGFGGADLVALAILAYLLLRSAGRRKPDDKDRFTVHRGGLGRDDQGAPPSDLSGGLSRDGSKPRDNAWSRKLRGGAGDVFGGNDSGRRNGATGPSDDNGNGKNPWSRKNGDNSAGQPRATVRDRAEAMWGHLASGRQESESPVAAVAQDAHVPAAFDVNDFLDGARALYVRLQQAWAARRIDDIAPFLSEDILTMLRGQAETSPEPSSVEILLVNATLQNVLGESDDQRAVVFFTALMRAQDADQPTEITEIWTFARNDGSGGNWQLINIEAA